jgi:tetratricopeptide (TPR) repeat protein
MMSDPLDNSSGFNKAVLTPSIEITQPSDYYTYFTALLEGRSLIATSMHFMNNTSSEDIQESCKVIIESYRVHTEANEVSSFNKKAYFMAALGVLKELYRESIDIEDVKRLTEASNFLLEMAPALQNQCNSQLFYEDQFSLRRLEHVLEVLADRPRDLKTAEELEPCFEVLRSRPDMLLSNITRKLTSYTNVYLAEGMMEEAKLCCDWLRESITALINDEATLYDKPDCSIEAVKLPSGTVMQIQNLNKTKWSETRNSLVACAATYEKLNQYQDAIECYDDVESRCKRIYLRDDKGYAQTLADILIKRANVRMAVCQYDEALDDAEKAQRVLLGFEKQSEQLLKDAELIERNCRFYKAGDFEFESTEPDFTGMGFDSEWDPEKDSGSSGGLI